MPPVDKNIDQKLPIIFIVGGPGSGKGTQCEKISEKYNLTHLSSGDLLRAEVNSCSDFGLKLKETMDAGKLVSLETVLELIRNAMNNSINAGQTKGFLIDGYPRDVKQGEIFEAEIQPCAKVIFFDASEPVLVNRLLKRGETSGRTDDNEETIKKRLHTYVESTKPVVTYYSNSGKLVRIEADRTVDEIFSDVCKVLDPIFNKN